jgi:hypothetical protein
MVQDVASIGTQMVQDVARIGTQMVQDVARIGTQMVQDVHVKLNPGFTSQKQRLTIRIPFSPGN